MKWLLVAFFLVLHGKSPCRAFYDSRVGTTRGDSSSPFSSWNFRYFLGAKRAQQEVTKEGKIQYWTNMEKGLLQDMRREGLSWEAISSELRRSPSACSQKYASMIKESYWSPYMHTNLLDLVVYYGENWTRIEQELLECTGRYTCAVSCRLHYLQFLRLFNLGPWEEEEIQRLMEVYPENEKTRRKGLREIGYIEDNNEDGYYVRLNNKGTESKLIPVVNWRNISHHLDRSSYDCRRQYMKIALDRDLDRVNDIWTESEMVYLRQLVDACGTHWVEIARDLGRKPVQCSNSFNNFYQINARRKYDTAANMNNVAIMRKESQQDNNNFDIILNSNCVNHQVNNDEHIGGDDAVEPTMTVRKIENRFCFWDDKEDKKLLALVNEHGNSWRKIGDKLGRTNSDCFQRYQILQVADGPHGWTSEQSEELKKLVEEKGPRWTEIGRQLKRTAYTCRAAYKRLLDKSNDPDAQMPKLKRQSRTEETYMERMKAAAANDVHGNGKLNHEWTVNDDEMLKLKVQQYGRRWSSIAEDMGRSPEDLMLRYDFKIMKRRSGPWTREEDEMLLKIVGEIGPRWTQIASKIGRTGPQCSMRYRFTLDPRLKWRLWSPQEDDQLLELRDQMGYNWGMISAAMDRAGPSCRHRYLRLKADFKREERESQCQLQ